MKQPTATEIVKHYEYDATLVDRVAPKIENSAMTHIFVIADPDPSWPSQFERFRSAIETALGPSPPDKTTGGAALSVRHVGSTSIPGMPAKPIIDVDLTVADILDEDSYRPQLEAAGFQMRCREPHWHQHRLFRACKGGHCRPTGKGEGTETGTKSERGGSPEAVRHLMFRDWIMENEDERQRYIDVKRAAMRETTEKGENVMAYNLRKEAVIRGILERCFKAKGLLV